MNRIIGNVTRFASIYAYQALVFFAFIIIYTLTMYPGAGGRVNFGDSIKWQFLYVANGLPHGPGYPQFLILTEIFSRLIFFLEGPERITFIPAFFGALSLSVFYSLLYLLTKNKIGSLISTFLTGFTYVFWTQATEPEVYTFNIFYLLTVFYLFIQFYLTKNSKYYLAGCAIYALSFGNHLSMITILPAIAFITLITNYKTVFAPKNLLLVALFVIIGMLQYAFIYYRAHSPELLQEYAEIPLNPTFEQFITYITGNNSGNMFAFYFNEIVFQRFPILFNFLNDNFTVFGLLFAFAGFFYYLYVKKQYVILSFITLAMLGQLIFNIGYNVGDLIVFFIPVYIMIGLFTGLIFSADKDLIPKVCLTLLTLYLFVHNTTTKDILTKNLFTIYHFKPTLYLYKEQKDNLPLYVNIGGDYYLSMFMHYLTLTELAPKAIVPALHLIRSDSFYVGARQEHFPELANFKFNLVAKENISDFTKKFAKPNHVLFFSVMDEASQNLPKTFIDYLKAFGSNIDSLSYQGSYAAVFHNGKLMEKVNGAGTAIISSDSLPKNLLQGKIKYEVISAGNPFGNNSVIKINGFDYSPKRRGMNIAVYDLLSEEVTYILTYDTHIGEEKELFKVKVKPPTVPAPPTLAAQYDLEVRSGEDISDFTRKFNKPNYVLFFSVMDEASQNLPKSFIDYLKLFGSNIDSLSYRGSYAGVFHYGKIVEEISGTGAVTINSEHMTNDLLQGKINYEVVSAGNPFGNRSIIKINDIDYSLKSRGMNIVVYDLLSNKVVDMVAYDTHSEEKNFLKAFKKEVEVPTEL